MTTTEKGSANGAVVVDKSQENIVTVDLDQLTVSEITAAEELSNVPINYVMDADKPKGVLFRALGCVVRRRTEPDFTWEQAADLRVYMMQPAPVPPTRGRGSSTKSRS